MDEREPERSRRVPPAKDRSRPYGPMTPAVRAVIEAIPSITTEGMIRCRLTSERLGADPRTGYVWDVIDQPALAEAAAACGREPETSAAFWDAGEACVRAWGDPVFLQHYCNDIYRQPISQAAQVTAAATVVSDVLDPDAQAGAGCDRGRHGIALGDRMSWMTQSRLAAVVESFDIREAG